MNSRRPKLVLVCCLVMAAEVLGTNVYARQAGQQKPESTQGSEAEIGVMRPDSSVLDKNKVTRDGQAEADQFSETKLGLSLLKNITLDQKAIWTSPSHLRLADADWILPFAGIAAVSLASDTHISKGLTHSPSIVSKTSSFSNYGIGALGGATGGMYLLGKITHNDHEQEAALLSGEAAVDAVGVTTVLQYSFGRQRPSDGSGGGSFWHGGTSFPSDHSTAAWAVASVMAHEYPGPLSKLFFYGLAAAVSASRVTGEDHFPTDVLVGSAIGWLVGQHVYRAHHDPELGGSSWETFSEARGENGGRNLRNTGSPYVPLDSWIYPAIDRLIALGYVHSAFQDVRPLTRTECATLVQEAGESIADGESTRGEGDPLYTTLRKEFQDEFSVLAGEGKEQSIRLESLYANVTQISGQPLNDSYHLGQTIINNYGRPYQEGFNTYDGFSAYGTAGRYTIYVRGEFQRAPSGPAFPLAAREAIASADLNPLQPATPVPAASQFRLLDTYISANVGGWDLSVGKQSLWWGRGVGGALTMSDNAEPMYMFRARPIESFELPWIFRWLGPMKTDFFFGKLSGNEFPARPLIHGVKITAKPARYFEASFIATSELGGVGRPLTLDAIINSFISVSSSDSYLPSRNPGKRTIGADFSYSPPHVRDWLQFYANGLLPEDNPTNFDMSQSPIYIWQRLAIRSGIYIPRLPLLPKLDFRVEAVYTDPPTARSRYGQYIYYNNFYHDLGTNKGNLIGDWVGRQGMGFQGWSTYWFSPRNSLQFAYRHAKVDSDFIPSGETINDGSVKVKWQLRSEWNLSASVQYEKWFAPILAPAAQTNWTSSVQIQFTPHSWGW
jgi:Capsule assembly protein Wzi/PAP2 superfamily